MGDEKIEQVVVLIVGSNPRASIGFLVQHPGFRNDHVITASSEFDLDALVELVKPELVYVDVLIDQPRRDGLRAAVKKQSASNYYGEFAAVEENSTKHPLELPKLVLDEKTISENTQDRYRRSV